MKKVSIFIVLLMSLAMAGCQNNGNIGWLFGVWRINSYTVDGVEQTDPLISRSTIAFQGEIVEIVAVVDDYQSRITRNGTWHEDGNDFTLNFTHSDDMRPAGTGVYEAPGWLGMTSDFPMQMTISDQTSDRFTLTWEDGDGLVKVYELQKTW